MNSIDQTIDELDSITCNYDIEQHQLDPISDECYVITNKQQITIDILCDIANRCSISNM